MANMTMTQVEFDSNLHISRKSENFLLNQYKEFNIIGPVCFLRNILLIFFFINHLIINFYEKVI